MIERGLLNQDSEPPLPPAPTHQQESPQPPTEPTNRTQPQSPGADTATNLFKENNSGSESKLNKLLQTPTINKINYMENYKLICPSSGMSITTSSSNTSNSATMKSNQKSVIQKGPNSGKREPPSATITSGAMEVVTMDGPGQQEPPGKTVVIINTASLQKSQLESYLTRGDNGGAAGGSSAGRLAKRAALQE